MHKDIYLHLSYRLASEQRTDKRILLQGIDCSLALPLISAAWNNGWSVAVVREDVSDDYIKQIKHKLGQCLHFITIADAFEPLVCSGKINESFTSWLNISADPPLPKDHYSWQDDECGTVLFTSGSTGVPKGVCHSVDNLMRSAKLFIKHFAITEEDHLLCLALPHTMSGMRSTILPLISSAKVSMPKTANLSFLELVKYIDRIKPTKIICGPVFIKQLAAYGKRISDYLNSVQALLCTGANLDETARSTVQSTLAIPVINYYGLTETSGIVMAETATMQIPYMLPPACENVKISLIPIAAEKQLFRLEITGENIYLGYLGEKLAKRSSFDTGDIVEKNTYGQLRFIGRASGAVKAPSTEWLFPDLLECWLKQQPLIEDAVVKTCNISGGCGIEVFIDNHSKFDTSVIDSLIINKFGMDYKPVTWHYSNIRRNQFSKIEDISTKEIV